MLYAEHPYASEAAAIAHLRRRIMATLKRSDFGADIGEYEVHVVEGEIVLHLIRLSRDVRIRLELA